MHHAWNDNLTIDNDNLTIVDALMQTHNMIEW